MIRAAVIAASLIPLAAPAIAQNAPPASANESSPLSAASRIEIHASPLLSLHMLVRAGAAGADVPACVAPAVEAMKATGDEVQWAVTDALFATAGSPAAAREVLGAMAGRFREDVGPKVLAYVDALAQVEPVFRGEVWPAHEARIAEARAGLEVALDAHGPSCIARICELLGMRDPGKAIPVYLVAAAPPPGGFTALSPQFGAVCIVSIDAHQGSALVEATLHEAIHALDTHTRQQQPASVLQSLRKALADAGVAQTDPLMRDVPHTLIFAVAAHVTRTSVDASHVAYGETGGYYAKVADAREAVLPAFQRYVAGEIDSTALVAEIVKIATKPE
ncbi:MAG: hypothetical protein KF912_12010 [Phycisphaeraceae bacterium]|nr:hypothetical protein [Phycisphaeraceae bacterium]MBX3368027.1 hypothetical protein [Phycisphaeraceae bacterium]QYK48064.1 MAG: hypothetical protein KF838_14895 [Phycisphaeraceae bacterium]